MVKTLKIKYPKDCIGCELCIFETQRQLKKVGLEGSLIRILKNKQEDEKKMEFFIELDPRVNQLDIEKIAEICPKSVFEVVEGESDGSSNSF